MRTANAVGDLLENRRVWVRSATSDATLHRVHRPRVHDHHVRLRELLRASVIPNRCEVFRSAREVRAFSSARAESAAAYDVGVLDSRFDAVGAVSGQGRNEKGGERAAISAGITRRPVPQPRRPAPIFVRSRMLSAARLLQPVADDAT